MIRTASIVGLLCLGACGAAKPFEATGPEHSMHVELRAYRIDEAVYERIVGPRWVQPAESLPRQTKPREQPATAVAAPEGVPTVDNKATPSLYVLSDSGTASAIALDLEALEPSDLHRRAVTRLELAPSRGCGARVEQRIDFAKDYEVEVRSASFEAHPVLAELREIVDLWCTFEHRDGGQIALEFEVFDQAVRRPLNPYSTTLGNSQPLRIPRPELERIWFGSRVAMRPGDTLLSTWACENGERGVVLLRAQPGEQFERLL